MFNKKLLMKLQIEGNTINGGNISMNTIRRAVNASPTRGSVGNVQEGSVNQIEEIRDDHPDVADAYNNMGVVYRSKARTMKLAMYEKALSIYLKKLRTTILVLLLRTIA